MLAQTIRTFIPTRSFLGSRFLAPRTPRTPRVLSISSIGCFKPRFLSFYSIRNNFLTTNLNLNRGRPTSFFRKKKQVYTRHESRLIMNGIGLSRLQFRPFSSDKISSPENNKIDSPKTEDKVPIGKRFIDKIRGEFSGYTVPQIIFCAPFVIFLGSISIGMWLMLTLAIIAFVLTGISLLLYAIYCLVKEICTEFRTE